MHTSQEDLLDVYLLYFLLLPELNPLPTGPLAFPIIGFDPNPLPLPLLLLWNPPLDLESLKLVGFN